MTAPLGYPVFDADHHMYETEDCFTRYLPKDLAGAIRYVQVKGRTKILVRGRLSEFIPNPTFEVVARPGATMDYFAGNNPEGKTLREMIGEPIRALPGFRNPADRLVQLDEFGVDRCFVFPTLVDEAIAELEFVLEHGAKAVLVRPAPVAGPRATRSPFLPEFDPFWARVQESGVIVALHASDSGYQRYVNDWEGGEKEFSGFTPTTFGLASMGSRPIQDTMFSAVCHGMLTRFPGVKLFSVENGAGWVGTVLATLDSVYKKLPQEFAEHPRGTFLRSVWVNPFWEDDIDALIDLIGVERVCFGSDYPHAEGLAEPLSWVSEITHRGPDEQRRIMGGNVEDMLGTAVPA